MKTLKDLIASLNDESFLNEFSEDVRKLLEEKKMEPKDAFIAVAKEKGYEVRSEEIDELLEQNAELMSDEELGKVAGGATPTILGVSFVVLFIGGSAGSASYMVTRDLDP